MKRLFSQAAGRHFSEIFEPDVVLPTQYAVPRGLIAQGERALLLAVLEMALRDLELFARSAQWLDSTQERLRETLGFPGKYWRSRQERDRLLAWFRSDSAAHATTFVRICETLKLDPDAIRKKLAERGWCPARSPTHLHATAQHPRQLHGGYAGGVRG
jgi:hypothetical protein